MPLTRQQKEERVAQMEKSITEATSVVFVSYTGLNITDSNELRDKLFAQGSRLRVMPKRLLQLITKKTNIEFDPVAQENQIAVIWGKNAVAPAKVTHEFAKKHENIKFLAGILEGKFLSFEEVTSLAKLPSREQLIGQLLSVMIGPLRGFETVLTGAQRNLVYALNAIKDKK
jgi:large subunit ribosomal protein L10